ncbi:MAG: SUMF1/EgtB/PvdO family nonheme iron enzyme [Treponema sp.]|jgi:hypothetical protein|nr:SUMF1/EgtB/PvdO family nonheme iron enzyme [Treponema sp.]
MLNKDVLLTGLMAASGGKLVVKYNVNGDPCVFTRIPRFNLEDIRPDLGTGPHPAFVVNGVVKSEILIATYPAIIEKGCAISIPGQSPKVSITFDAAKTACEANGPGFHLMTAWEWAAVALWCFKNGFQPRGNTNNGKSHEAAWETGTPAPDNALKTLGGSGPVSWRHDGTLAGISDLVGNVWEWNDGLKLIDGRLYFPLDNYFTQAAADWPASAIYLDATAGPGDRDGAVDSGDIVISDRITKYSETPTPLGGTDPGNFDYAYNTLWAGTAVAATFDALPLETRQKAAQLMIAPKLASGGTAIFPDTKGGFWGRNYGERRPIRGGYWVIGATAGLGALGLYNRASNSNGDVGCRPAFIL